VQLSFVNILQVMSFIFFYHQSSSDCE